MVEEKHFCGRRSGDGLAENDTIACFGGLHFERLERPLVIEAKCLKAVEGLASHAPISPAANLADEQSSIRGFDHAVHGCGESTGEMERRALKLACDCLEKSALESPVKDIAPKDLSLVRTLGEHQRLGGRVTNLILWKP